MWEYKIYGSNKLKTLVWHRVNISRWDQYKQQKRKPLYECITRYFDYYGMNNNHCAIVLFKPFNFNITFKHFDKYACTNTIYRCQCGRTSGPLPHWGRMTHICIINLTIIGSDNGLSPGRRQAIIWTIAGIFVIRNIRTNISAILSEIHTFS